MKGFQDKSRALLSVTGADAESFLQGLVTTDVAGLGDALGYTALLTPQGKYLFDFFIQRRGDGFCLDVAQDRAAALAQRLTMYRLRAAVEIAPLEGAVFVVEADVAGQVDPRDARLGSRIYGEMPEGYEDGADHAAAYDARLVALGVPTTGRELLADESYILEAGFERLSGVDFRKGCYVGQEVTARMRHKTELRKGLVQVRLSGAAAAGSAVVAADGKEAGRLLSVADGLGLAYLRLDRAKGGIQAGDAALEVVAPVWDLGEEG